jgi:hypothetical protein
MATRLPILNPAFRSLGKIEDQVRVRSAFQAQGLMSAMALLDRLQGVHQTGPGRWLAKCPAHEDRSPSLSIRELDDGTVLIKDFGGCGAADVMAAVGLSLRGLFPELLGQHRRAPSRSRIPAMDALAAIDHEAHVVAVIGADIHEHRELDEPTWDRLALAVRRIGDARAAVAPLITKVAK